MPEVISRLSQRAQRPLAWVAISLFTVPFASLLIWQRSLRHSFWIGDLVETFALSASYGLLSPMPWQWSGDDRLGPPFLRGALQAMATSIVLIVVIFGTAGWLDPHQKAIASKNIPLWMLLQAPVMTFIGWTIARGESAEVERREIQAQAREAQWALLSSQLSPHFLFNALSAFAELGRRDWPATERGLLDLAQVYRKLLALSERAEATLGEERQLVEAYLAVEQLRLGNRLEVTWDWDPALDAHSVPPLLLLPLVENAIKHGVAPHPDACQVRIEAMAAPHGIHLSVDNNGLWGDTTKGTGVGLKNLRARLLMAHRGRATFELAREEGWTRARIFLPG